MTVTVYRSSDASAPVLTGQVGSLITVLDACLVTGYGALGAAGWAKEFTATNKAVYRAAAGNRMRLRIDDTFGNESRAVGYETMTTVDAGTNAFPTNVQLSGGMYIRKSNTADATARPWVIVATEKAFYFLPDSAGANWLTAPAVSSLSGQFYFGEFQSFKSGDLYNTMIIGADTSGTNLCQLGQLVTSGPTHSNGSSHYLARSYLNTGTSILCSKRALYDVTSSPIIGYSGGYYPPFPDIVTNDMMISPIVIYEPSAGNQSVIRGMMSGLWAPLHQTPGAHADTINGSGTTAGKTFLLFDTAMGSTNGRGLLEISNTW